MTDFFPSPNFSSLLRKFAYSQFEFSELENFEGGSMFFCDILLYLKLSFDVSEFEIERLSYENWLNYSNGKSFKCFPFFDLKNWL